MKLTQADTPLLDTLLRHAQNEVVSFHTPGHKNGAGIIPKLRNFTKQHVYALDVTVFPEVDSLHDPTGCIRQAQELCAKAYGSRHAFFLVNGSTGGNLSMLMSVCDPGDSIILSRVCHKSVLAGIITANIWPIWLQPKVDQYRDLIYDVSSEDVARALEKYPEAKAVFITSPNYNGITTDVRKIAELCHKHGKILMVDEAHGPHLRFHPDLPESAGESGADIYVNSMHKVLSAMSQGSVLHVNSSAVDVNRVRRVVSMLQTTSPNYLILASLDAARMQAVKQGNKLFGALLAHCAEAREELNKLPNIFAMTREEMHNDHHDMDATKLTVNVTRTGLTGYRIEDVLAEEFRIQVDCADMFNLIAITGIGTTENDLERFVSAMGEIARRQTGDEQNWKLELPPLTTEVVMLPRDAFFSHNVKRIPLSKAASHISAQTLVPYPPGLPVLTPGERITQDIVVYLQDLAAHTVRISGQESEALKTIKVIK
jgi:arginine/lysine/ornithine decarboxylase